MEFGNNDGLPPFKGNEKIKEQAPCFPVNRTNIDSVTREIQTKFTGDMGKFVDMETREIAKDEKLNTFMDIASGWFEERGGGDRPAFLDGAAFVHRALREQGEVPLMQEDPSEAMRKEEDAYQDVADTKNETLTDVLAYADKSAFSRIPELTSGWDTELGKTLKQMTENHPSKPSFVVGAEMMYSVLKQADMQNLALEAQLGQTDMDAELAALLEEK
jgi:hypothetical protein